MKIYKIAQENSITQPFKRSMPYGSSLEKMAANPESKIKKLEQDIRDLKSDVKKIRGDIGSRRFWQQSSVFNTIERKLERYEVLENQFKELKKTLKEDVRRAIEKSHRAQIKDLGPAK